MSNKIKIEKAYNGFIGLVTDDMYVTMDEQDLMDELEDILIAAMPRFRYPRVPLSTDGDDFSEGVTQSEVQIISMLMVEVWLERQINNIRLTELNISGNDAKALGTGSQLRALEKIKDSHRKTVERQLKYYHYSQTGDGGVVEVRPLKLGGKSIVK